MMLRATIVVLLLAVPALGQEAAPAGAVRVGSTRFRHGEEIAALVYSPDGKLLASADGEGDVQVHDAATGQLRRRFTIEPAATAARDMRRVPRLPGGLADEDLDERGLFGVALRFSPDSKRLVAGTRGAVRAYRLDDGQVDFSAALAGEQCLAISPRLVVAVGGEAFRLREFDAAGKPARQRTVEDLMPTRAAFTPHGLLVTGNFSGVRLLDATSGQVRDAWSWSEYDQVIAELAPDGKRLALIVAKREGKPDELMVTRSTSLVLWNARGDGKRLMPPGVRLPECVTYAPDGTSLAVACRDGLLLLDAKSGRVMRAMAGAPRLTRLAFSPDGKTLAGAGGMTVMQWEVATGKRLAASAEPAGPPQRLRFLDSRRLRVVAGDVLDYDWRSNSVRKRFNVPPRDETGDAELTADGKWLAVSDERAVRLIDAATGQVRQEIELAGGKSAFSPNGSRLYLFTEEGPVDVVDVQSGKRSRLFEDDTGVTDHVVSPDGKFIAATRSSERGDGLVESNIRLWDAVTGATVRDLHAPDELTGEPVFSPDGRRVAVMTAREVQLNANGEASRRTGVVVWDVASGRLLRVLTDVPAGANVFDLSADGRSIVVGNEDGAVYVIEVATGAERAKLAGHKRSVLAVAFSPDGRSVASASADAPVYVWDLYSLPSGPAAAPAALWAELCRDDIAFLAMRRLAAAPDAAVALFRERVRPVPAVAEARLRQLLADLDSPRYAVRNRANAELQRVADQAEAHLMKHAAAPSTSAEARRQARRLLERVDEPSADFVVRLRAVEVLERIDSPAAKALLAEWAAGAPAARFTREAAAALERMKR
jgi:WD40 repeat protein